MGVYEIVFGVVLILACLLIVVFTLAQEQKGHGLSTTALWPPAVSAGLTPSWPSLPRSWV